MARLPNSLSFRLVSTLTVADTAEIPPNFTGRVLVETPTGSDSVLWLDRGQLDDPAPDVPAVTRYRPSGAVKQVRHYRSGRLHDPDPGTAAVRGYFSNGSPKYAEHFRYGWRQDHDGIPAIRKWRVDGSLRLARRYVDNMRVDDVRPERPATDSASPPGDSLA